LKITIDIFRIFRNKHIGYGFEMKLYLIRHTSVKTLPFLCYGQTDVDVSDQFQIEAEQVKHIIKPHSKMIFYSSPSLRCRRLTEQLTPEYLIEPKLMELNFGDWENQSWKNIEITPEFKHWADNFYQLATPHGESYQTLQNRVSETILKIIYQYPDDAEIVIITHGGPIRAFLAKILKIPLKDSFRKNIDFHSVTLLEIPRSQTNQEEIPHFNVVYENTTSFS